MENPPIDRERDSIQTRISIYHLWVFILSSGSGQYIIWLRILYVIVLQKIQVTIIITTQLSWSQFSIPFSNDHQRYSGCFLLENGNLLPIPSYLFGIINNIIATTSIKSIIILIIRSREWYSFLALGFWFDLAGPDLCKSYRHVLWPNPWISISR